MKRWTQAEIDTVTKYYPIYGAQYCANLIDRTIAAINCRAAQLGIKSGQQSTQNRNKRTRKNENTIVEELNSKGFKLAEDYINSQTKTKVVCPNCNEIFLIKINDILHNNVKQCRPCYEKSRLNTPRKDVVAEINKKYNYLTIIEYIGINNNKGEVKCMCDCGNIWIGPLNSIKTGNTKSCGCLAKKEYKYITGSEFCSIRIGAEKRNINFNITIKEIDELYEKQNKKCALTRLLLDFNTIYYKGNASIDRIDNSLGYEISNIQIVHKDINRIKWTLSLDELYYWAHLVTNPAYIKNKRPSINLYSSFWKRLVRNSSKSKRKIEVSIKDIKKIYDQQQGLCYITGIPIYLPESSRQYKEYNYTASLDRINSLLHYSKNNIGWCHKTINFIKSNYSICYFKQLCYLIDLNAK